VTAPAHGVTAPARVPDRAFAPWAAWAGLALLLGGVVGAGVRRPRRRRVPVPPAVAQEVR
jgi:hypothetical protein